jgi:tRNA nucleotidyltransferase/poly(A) polymerase
MSDYNFLMESRLSPEQYTVVTLISRLAAEQGLNLYLVGGAVRDLTFGQQVVRDLDFAIEGPPQRILRLLPSAETPALGRETRGAPGESAPSVEYQVLDESLHSADLRFSNGVRAELAMCREESIPRPGQSPDVRPATIFDDLKRRDLSLNAMAVSLHPNSRGLLLDPTNGAGDIERHELRALYSRSFLDEPVRIYRLLRLGLRLDFKPEERTQRWLDTAMGELAWERLDAAQQARELAATLHEDHPGRVLKMLADRKLLGGLDKKLASAHLVYERFSRIRNVLQTVPGADAFLLNFHALVEKFDSEHTARLAKKIVGETKSVKLALSFDQDARKLERVLGSGKANLPSQAYALLSPQPPPLLFFLLTHTSSVKVQNRIKNYLFKAPQVRAALPRNELQSLGLKPGPEYDRIMEKIFHLQLDGKIKSHPQLMKELRAAAGIKEPPPPVIKKPKETAAATTTAAPAKAAAKGAGKPAPVKLSESAKPLVPAAKPAAKAKPPDRTHAPARAASKTKKKEPKPSAAKKAKRR